MLDVLASIGSTLFGDEYTFYFLPILLCLLIQTPGCLLLLEGIETITVPTKGVSEEIIDQALAVLAHKAVLLARGVFGLKVLANALLKELNSYYCHSNYYTILWPCIHSSIWEGGTQGSNHTICQFWMVALQFDRIVRKTNYQCIDGSPNDIGNDRTDGNAHHEAKSHGNPIRPRHWTINVRVKGTISVILVNLALNQNDNHTGKDTNRKVGESQHVAHQIVSNKGCKATSLEQLHHLLSTLQVAVSIDTHVDICPLIEVLKNILQTLGDAIQKTQADCSVVIPAIARGINSCTKSRHQGLQQGAHANGPKAVCEGPIEGVVDSNGAAILSFFLDKAPCGHDSGDSHLHRVL